MSRMDYDAWCPGWTVGIDTGFVMPHHRFVSFIVMPVQVYGPRLEAPNLYKAHPHREAVTSDAYEGDDSH